MKSDKLQTTIRVPGDEQLQLSAKFFGPATSSSGITFFCLPGGGASQEYFDLGLYGGVDYSFVSRMTDQGHAVITMDHPGTGTNPLSESHPFLKPRQSSDYIGQAIADFVEQTGVCDNRLIGLGHSMGGMMTILVQARHQAFQGIALLGSSAGGLDWGLDDHEKAYIDRPDAIEGDLEELVIRKFGAPFIQTSSGPSGKSIMFGGATEKLTARLREISIPLYAAGGMMSMIRGSFLPEVEAINVSLFFAFGDHDIGIPPEEAPKPFTGTSEIELQVLDNAGHNSFAFPVIETLCAKLDRWSRSF